MSQFIGRHNSLALFTNDTNFVAIDTDLNMVIESGYVDENFSLSDVAKSEEEFSTSILSLASDALDALSPKPLVASARLYTIPTGVQEEAKRSLEWHKEHKRGGTPVGLNTARTLAKGGQIGIEKIRHIAKYFPRHEVDKKGKGFEPGEDKFPSNGRIAWALWGGDAGRRWASAIVERENNKPIKADAYVVNTGAELESFDDSYALDDSIAPDFIARVRLDGSGIDRVYKIDFDGQVYVWDDGVWDNLGNMEGEIWSYDSALDDPEDYVEKSHILIDPDSAVVICAHMTTNPYKAVSVGDIDEAEAKMAMDAIEEEDWDFIDNVVTAAGAAPIAAPISAPKGNVSATDKVYSPAERSQNASKQVRDAGGKFASQGDRVSVKGAGNGTIVSTNGANQTITVKQDNGAVVTVPAKSVEQMPIGKASMPVNAPVGGIVPGTSPNGNGPTTAVDTTGIFNQNNPNSNNAKATLPDASKPISVTDLQSILSDYPAWVASQRAAIMQRAEVDSKTPAPLDEYGKKLQEETGIKVPDSPFEDPLLSKWLNKRVMKNGKATYPNRFKGITRYRPNIRNQFNFSIEEFAVETVTSNTHPADTSNPEVAPKSEKPKAQGAQPSDVTPLYMAIVAPEDPRAVLDLVAVVPASASSNEPMTYIRQDQKWVRYPQYIADLKSATPPAVVPLDEEVLNDVLTQIDTLQASAGVFSYDHALMVLFGPTVSAMENAENEFLAKELDDLEALFAAGGLDRNRGNADKLRRYWVHGEGAAKIRWGQKGDWKRCVRHLSKYLGVRAKGYCQLRHKEATGVYTSTHAKMDRARHNSSSEFIMEEVITENYGTPTVVTDKDMLLPIADIMKEQDDLYDHHWEPSGEMCVYLNALAKCSDDEFEAITAGARPPSAYNIDSNRKNADRLRRYWTKGKGAAKIRWNTGGDWTRCVRHLSKYLGPRAKGYCALRHKEVTGEWTGDTAHLKRFGGRRHGKNVFSNEVINSTERVLELSSLVSRVEDLKNRVGLTASADVQSEPVAFKIPLVIPEGIESGDGRKFDTESITIRELPLPLMWQIQTGDGHNGSVVVGRIDHMERTEDGIGNAYGVFDSGKNAQEVIRLVKNGFIKGVSADMDKFEAKEVKPEPNAEASEDDEKQMGKDKIIINKARVMGVTIVPKPAFQECKIYIDGNSDTETPQEAPLIADGIYIDDVDSSDAEALVACGMVASSIPVTPPAEWFENPKLDKATPLTVDDSGRVFGHIAAWHVDHIGMAFGTKPPRSKSNYAYFHTGVVRTEAGTDVPVGQLTLAGGHASLHASAQEAAKHYDDTASAIADVHAGEDQYGIWVAGSLRPDAQPEQIRALRASAPSGDWRPIRGSLELVAVCQVNVPGFPIARARVASGAVMALVAAGAFSLAKLKADPVTELSSRLERLENLAMSSKSDELAIAKEKFASVKAEMQLELSAKAEALAGKVKKVTQYADLAVISEETRQKLAESGEAMKDGSYPIRNTSDLKNAIKAYGRAKNKSATKKHIIKRAEALGKTDLIPENWVLRASGVDLRSRIENFSTRIESESDPKKANAPVAETGAEFAVEAPISSPESIPATETVTPEGESDKGIFTPKTQPRDEQGKFREVLARLKQNLGTAGLQKVLENAKEVENLHEVGDYAEAAGASIKLLDIVDRLDAGALNKVSLENVRDSASELGKVISNLPLGFNNQAEKVRYSDLPPALKNLMDSMMDRVVKKIGKKDGAEATQKLQSFKSGSDVFSQGEISAEMSRMLRLLT